MLLIVFISTTLAVKANKNFSIAVELENDTLNLSDTNLSRVYDDSYYYFWTKAIITNQTTSSQKLTIWVCGGFNFEVKSDTVQSALACLKNFPKVIWLQPKEAHKVRIPLRFRKDYAGDRLKFRIKYRDITAGWSAFATVKIRRQLEKVK